MLRLKAERKRLGWSQQELAVQAKMHSSEICRIERGFSKAWPSQVLRLEKVFGLPIADLMSEVAG
jgi:transcriptional regulator with XRE-family HTH domain